MKLCKPQEKLIYFTQRNNYGSPHSECFPTSVTMAIVNNGVETIDKTLRNFCIDDIYDHWIESRRRSADAKYQWQVELEECINFLNQSPSFGGNAFSYVKWLEGASLYKIKTEIDNGYCVVAGTKKLGGLPGGHIVTIVGYDDKNFYLYDPFGDHRTNYREQDGKLTPVPFNDPAIEILGKDKYRVMLIHSDRRLITGPTQ